MKTSPLLYALLLTLPLTAIADGYPSRPIHLVVPYAAGGGTDTAARLLAQHLSTLLNQAVIVENKAGGATLIGTGYVVRAKPDGYTLLMGTANLATNPALYDSLPYNAETDLKPVAQVTDVPVYLFANAQGDIQDLSGLLEHAHRSEDTPYATAGMGSIPHLTGELFTRLTGSKMIHVPYKGSSEAVTGLLSDQVPVTFDNLAPPLAQVRAGHIRPLAIAAKTRSASLPDVPTLKELGQDLEASSWWGVLAPANTPDTIINTLNQAIQTVVDNPEVREFFIQQGMHPVGGSAAEFTQHIRQETEKWGAIIKQANIRIGS